MASHGDREVLQRCLSFLADLNGSNWIHGTDPGSLDMKQRAKALQGLAFETIHGNSPLNAAAPELLDIAKAYASECAECAHIRDVIAMAEGRS